MTMRVEVKFYPCGHRDNIIAKSLLNLISALLIKKNDGCCSFEGTIVEQEDTSSIIKTPILKVEGYVNPPEVDIPLSLGEILTFMKIGKVKKIARKGWNGKNMWLCMQVPDEHSKMTLPYLYIEYPEGHPAYPKGSRVPWLASQTDLLSEDWIIIE